MATLRQIKDKQNSVLTINKITKAMKLVSSAKSQKAIKNKKEYDNYFKKVEKVIGEISDNKKQDVSFKGTYWVLIMSDLGLAGGYNNNVLKLLQKNIQKGDEVIILGMKGMTYKKQFPSSVEISDLTSFNHSNKLSELTIKIKHQFHDQGKEVKVIYTEYASQVDFDPVIKTILPIQPIELEEEQEKMLAVTTFEPEKDELLKELEGIYIHSYLVKVFKESQAAEHTSRKNAMDNATKNGEELLDKLHIEYNRGRQAKITQEISEIIGGAESLK